MFSPPGDFEYDGRSTIEWKGDTPHPVSDPDNPTAETLWLSDSNSGDYHNNVDGGRFMHWVEDRMMPTFRKQFPGKLIIPCLDNAPYHHNRGVPSLSAIETKAALYKLMTKGVESEEEGAFAGLPAGATITLPKVKNKRSGPRAVPITDAFLQPAKLSLPDVPTVPEMKAGFIAAMEADPNLAHHLDCKFESFISQQNKEIFQAKCKRDPNLPTGWSNWLLWTPPYCPTLQPVSAPPEVCSCLRLTLPPPPAADRRVLGRRQELRRLPVQSRPQGQAGCAAAAGRLVRERQREGG